MGNFQPNLELSFDEYSQLWTELLTAAHFDIVECFKTLDQKDEDRQVIYLKSSFLVYMLGSKAIELNKSMNTKTTVSLLAKIEEAFVKKAFHDIDEEFTLSWKKSYDSEKKAIDNTIKNISQDISPVTALVVSTLSDLSLRKEEIGIISSELSNQFEFWSSRFNSLSKSSSHSPKIFGKPSFIVKKSGD